MTEPESKADILTAAADRLLVIALAIEALDERHGMKRETAEIVSMIEENARAVQAVVEELI